MAQCKIPMDETRFKSGLTWKDYMAQMGDTRARTEENYAKYVIMTAENWCGDVHRNSPLIANIVEAIPGAELRVFFRDKETDLRDAVLNNGYQSIPVVVFLDKDWNEIGRWVERAHAATGKAALIRSKTIDVAPADKKDEAMNEFRKLVNDAYNEPGFPLWRAAANEVKLLLEARAGK